MGRATTRYQVSGRSLRSISARSSLRDAFLAELEDAMAELGWLVFRRGDDFSVVEIRTVDAWPKISSARIRDVLRRAHNPRSRFDYAELGVEAAGVTEEDDGE